MSQYVIYLTATGQVTESGDVHPFAVPLVTEALQPGTQIFWGLEADLSKNVVYFEDGELVLGMSTFDLDLYKVSAARQVDEAAERLRGSFITLGAGMAMVYEQKLREAELISANTAYDAELGQVVTTISPHEVPNLVVEAADLGVTLLEAAGTVITMGFMWAQVSAPIESKRLGAKRAIAAAVNKAEVDAAVAVEWTLS